MTVLCDLPVFPRCDQTAWHQQFPCRPLHKAQLRKAVAIPLNESGCAPLDDSATPTVPAALSPPFTFSPSAPLSCCFIRSCAETCPGSAVGEESEERSGSHFRSHLLQISRRKVISSGGSGESLCARSASFSLQGDRGLSRVDSRDTRSVRTVILLSFFLFFLFVQLTTVRRLSLIETTPPPGGVNPTLNSRSTRLHLLCARRTHPRDAAFLYASSLSWVPRWVEEGMGIVD